MLSRIFKAKEIEKLQIEKFNIPSASEIQPVLEKKKQEMQRKNVTDADKDESPMAAEKESDRILIEVREKLKAAEAEDNLLKTRLENQMVELVFSVCHKVIGDEIKTSPEVVLKMLKKGLDKIKAAKEYEIKVNPTDYDFFINWKDEIKQTLKNPGSIKFTKDKKIEEGGCQIITREEEISTEPGKQLDIIKRAREKGTAP